MNPKQESGGERPQGPEHQFPPDISFLSALRKAAQMEDYQDKMALLWTFLENVRNFGDRLRKHGLDPDRFIHPLQEQLEAWAKAEKDVDEHQDKVLHLAADVADANRRLVDAIERAVKEAAEEKPFDPDVQDWQEQVEELRRQYPKID